MKNLSYEVFISATKEKVWTVLTSKATYSKWAKAFSPNSEFVGNWEEGSEIKFVDKDMGGTLAKLKSFKPFNEIVAEHIATINKEGVVETTGPMTEKWIGCSESYFLIDEASFCRLRIEMNVHEDFEEMFNSCWPEALVNLKNIAEKKEY